MQTTKLESWFLTLHNSTDSVFKLRQTDPIHNFFPDIVGTISCFLYLLISLKYVPKYFEKYVKNLFMKYQEKLSK